MAYDSAVKMSGFLAVALGASLGLLPIAPPEHMHEEEEQGHLHAVVHRHLAPHGILEHPAGHQSTLDDDDGPVLTLTTIYTVPPVLTLAAPQPIMVGAVEPPPPRLLEPVAADIEILIHGPPRAPTPPRAPPSLPAA
jgi:hypothetical protein